MEKRSGKELALKSVIWRLMGVAVLATITYIFTGNWITVGLVTIIHHATFLFVFWVHERAWQRFPTFGGAKRHIIKALFYEIVLGMGLGGLIVLTITGEWTKVTQITPIYTVVKLVMYFFYDKIWSEFKK